MAGCASVKDLTAMWKTEVKFKIGYTKASCVIPAVSESLGGDAAAGGKIPEITKQ